MLCGDVYSSTLDGAPLSSINPASSKRAAAALLVRAIVVGRQRDVCRQESRQNLTTATDRKFRMKIVCKSETVRNVDVLLPRFS